MPTSNRCRPLGPNRKRRFRVKPSDLVAFVALIVSGMTYYRSYIFENHSLMITIPVGRNDTQAGDTYSATSRSIIENLGDKSETIISAEIIIRCVNGQEGSDLVKTTQIGPYFVKSSKSQTLMLPYSISADFFKDNGDCPNLTAKPIIRVRYIEENNIEYREYPLNDISYTKATPPLTKGVFYIHKVEKAEIPRNCQLFTKNDPKEECNYK